ncbi:CAP domain-containing protein [Roseateles asaccharophilus]|uniref:Uncharacterized protein YkwD n=1 Tax=Roseateles asaccharophilus TaxID=582607 RepID=A0ABU2AFE3_9BURK|nr:CAP domain-containing protein [Roseateles asaccharophilus]MDR7335187.1 uncharacterized protein YkwD [Roseateles asaccharophilus]
MRVLLLLSLCLALSPATQGCQPGIDATLAALNALRASPQTCGGRAWPAVPALRWQDTLAASARSHAVDLAGRDRLDHLGANGAPLRQRLREAGYAMRLAGENLAGGPETLDEALVQWLASPAHCENLMEARFEEAGLACVTGPGSLQRYWVLQLAAPARTKP